MFAFPEEIRRAVYTTNAMESLNMSLRKIIKNRPSFPSTDAVTKLLYLALNKISKKWAMPIREWGPAMNEFAIIYGDRVPLKIDDPEYRINPLRPIICSARGTSRASQVGQKTADPLPPSGFAGIAA